MHFSFRRKALTYGFVVFLATVVAAQEPNVNVDVIHIDSSNLLDPSNEPVLQNSLKEFEDAIERSPDHLLKACPSSCSDLGSPSQWFVYPDAARLALCNETMLLEFSVSKDLEGNDKTAIRACQANYGSVKTAERSQDTASICTTPNHLRVSTAIKVFGTGSAGRDAKGVLAATEQIKSYVSSRPISCDNNTISFGYSGKSIVGLYSGKEVHQQGVTAQVLEKFQEYVQQGGVAESVVVQLCNADDRGADYAIGIAASLSGDLSFVQKAAKAWNDGKCASGVDEITTLTQLTFNVPNISGPSNGTTNGTTNGTASTEFGGVNVFRPRLAARADCRTTKVESGDGCWALANRCGISQSDLTKYNTRNNFCNTLSAGEAVCCSSGTLPDTSPPANSDGTCQTRRIESGDTCTSLASKCGVSTSDFTKNNKELCSSPLSPGGIACCGRGTLPDIRPKPNSDGSCFVYQTRQGDDCSVIAASNGLKVDDLDRLNKNTWGWNGCKKVLWVGVNVCLSSGDPPMPAPVSNAVCGPTVPGTQKPSAGTNLTSLNPCPLKVCCNIWGQCGTTADFCTAKPSDSGAPGTSGVPNGCVANCGMDIVSSGPPASKIKIAYFESWNWNRKCLHMHVDSIDTSVYTHIHFAFANITSDFRIDVSGAQDEFDRFTAMTGVKKIISFGGWAFSTEPGTFRILREAVKSGNRARFIGNLLTFVASNGLDGIDLDWEYPGAPDIPGVPPSGDKDEGKNYYETLKELKSKIGSGKTVSFAAPASYWYLRAFPVELMGAALDYIVYMTYDLHGQWDYGNKWTSPGCENGNCLRSHVNLTETINALSMITKAGVASNKVVVGVTSYGRSFKMAQAGCTGPECLFTGSSSVSNAAKGDCTDTAGYISDAEIGEIIRGGNVQQYIEEDSNILVYGGGTEWVAYMDNKTKSGRESLYAKYNFAGTTDWAVDLQAFNDDEDAEEDDPLYGTEWPEMIEMRSKTACTSQYRSLDALEKDADKISADCFDKYLVDVEVAILGDSLDSYDKLIKGDYDKKFSTYEKSMKEQIPYQIYKYMGGAQKTGFFECTETKHVQCCKDCSSAFACQNGCSSGSNCKSGKAYVKADCPTMLDYPGNVASGFGDAPPNITYKLTNEDGFYKDIADKYGIDRSWISWGKRRVLIHTGCKYAGDKVKECQEKNDGFWYNYPLPADKIEIPNPKNIIGANYTQMRNLKTRMENESKNAAVGGTSRGDIVDSGSLPALMMQFAVTSMDKVVDTANKIEEQERKSTILNFVLGFLMFIPFVGQTAGALGSSVLRTIINVAGELANIGVAIYEVVDDPDNALLTVMGLLLGGASLKPFKEVAQARRGMKNSEYEKLGPIKTDLGRIDTLKGRGLGCKKS